MLASVVLPLLLGLAQTLPGFGPVRRFDGQRAFEYTRAIVALGERPPGSRAHRKMEQYILARLKKTSAAVESDNYTAQTPKGPIAERNIIARFGPADGDHIILLGGHYDTLFMPGFVGANDGGASAGILLAMADALSNVPLRSPVWLVFFDGEEAVKRWSNTDSLYGSRHFVEKLKRESLTPKIKALILMDMIGDKDLDIERETNSTRWLQDFIASAAEKLGYQSYFFHSDFNATDDHIPFLRAGIPAADIADFTYGPPPGDGFGRYHHTREDTMDKLSSESFTIVGKTVLEAVELLEGQ